MMNETLSFFNLQINNIQTKLDISSDLAYLLLKKFEWNEEDVISIWSKDQSGILRSLNIDTDTITCKENLRLKQIENGLCPICNQNQPLYQLYCKHSACIECWKNNILNHLKSHKIARCIHNQSKPCNSILFSQNVQSLFDEQIHQNYVKVILDDFIDSNPNIYRCNSRICNEIILKDESLPCNLGLCRKCNYHFCFKCGCKNGHFPVLDCNKVNDFYLTLPTKLSIIVAAQKRWAVRESKLAQRRRQHLEAVEQAHSRNLESIKQIHKNLSDQELQKIEELNHRINQTEQRIKEIENQSTHNDQPSINETPNDQHSNENEKLDVNSSISTNENDELSELKKLHELLISDRNKLNRKHKLNDLQRKSDENFINIASDSILSSYPEKATFLSKFNSVIKQKVGNVDEILKRECYKKPTNKRCPKCHTKIVKTKYDTNRVHCDKCKYDFCWICEDKWHVAKAYCPKLCTNSSLVNYGNTKDDKYYIPPILDVENLEVLNWIQFNNRFLSHQKAIAKLEVDFEPLLRNKLKEINQVDDLFAFQLFNSLMFAMSTISWIFPFLYYNHSSVMEFDMIMTSAHINQFYTSMYNPTGKEKDFFMSIMKQTEDEILALISWMTENENNKV